MASAEGFPLNNDDTPKKVHPALGPRRGEKGGRGESGRDRRGGGGGVNWVDSTFGISNNAKGQTVQCLV